MPSIVSFGEILIDLTEIGKTPGGDPIYAAYPGGAPANLAVAAARLGTETAFVGKVGFDPFGDQLRRTLRDNGVDTSFLYTDPVNYTTVATVSLDSACRQSYHFFRSPGADSQLTQEEAMAGLWGRPKVFHFGSVALSTEPSRSAVLSAAAMAHRLGALISFSPSYRDSLWPSQADAIFNIRQVLPMCDLIRLTACELEMLTGTSDLDKGTEQITSGFGILLCIVTLGSEGSYYRYRGKSGRIPAHPCEPVDLNGAGDSFFGAILARLCEIDDGGEMPIPVLEDMMHFASKAASITCSRHGAMPAMPTREEVEQLP